MWMYGWGHIGDKGGERDKGRRLGEREKRRRLLWLALLTANMIFTNIPLPLTTIQGQGVFVHVCVHKHVCWLLHGHSITKRRWQFHVVWHLQALSKCLLGNTHSLFLSSSQTRTQKQTEHLLISTEWLWLHHWWEMALSVSWDSVPLMFLQMQTQQNLRNNRSQIKVLARIFEWH